jgi:hypothetical protein
VFATICGGETRDLSRSAELVTVLQQEAKRERIKESKKYSHTSIATIPGVVVLHRKAGTTAKLFFLCFSILHFFSSVLSIFYKKMC